MVIAILWCVAAVPMSKIRWHNFMMVTIIIYVHAENAFDLQHGNFTKSGGYYWLRTTTKEKVSYVYWEIGH